MVYADEPLHERTFGERVGENELKIGEYVAELIEDRSTLQMGMVLFRMPC